MKEKQQQSLKDYAGPDAVISAHEMELRLRAQGDSKIQVKSMIPSLDHAIGDFRDGELIAVSGPTKNGKTLLAQTLTRNFDKQQQPALWFTYEVPARQFLEQFDGELPLIYLPQQLKAHAMPWVEARILEAFLKYRTRIVFIDHLHYLVDLARMRNPSLEIGQVIRRLKVLAVREGLVVFLLCHTTKGKPEGNLSYESIRDSSFISQESDSVLMIKRTPEDGEASARLRVEFHRRTGALEKVIRLQKTGSCLVEITEREDPGTRNHWDR